VPEINLAESMVSERRVLRSVEFDRFVDYKSECSANISIVLNYLQRYFVVGSEDRWSHLEGDKSSSLAWENRAMREYAALRGWTIALQVNEVGSRASQRQLRDKLL